MPNTLSQNLFRTAALINAVSIAGHTKLGFDIVHPKIATMSAAPPYGLVSRRAAQTCFNYLNASFLVAALLNYQWSRTRGPQTAEEEGMMWTIALAGAVSGWRFWLVRAYPPLGVLLVAPACSLAGWWVG